MGLFSILSSEIKKNKAFYPWMSLFIVLYWLFIIPRCSLGQEFKPPAFSGYFRLQAGMGFPGDDDFRNILGKSSSLFDKAGDFRLLSEWLPSGSLKAEVHYEAAASGGDTRKIISFLDESYPGASDYFSSGLPSDRARVFNLTHDLKDEDDVAMYHRLDRLNATYSANGLSLCMGRQAMTWGRGMIFNPVDMFNPFSPTSLIRDYKTGDDMVIVNFPASERGDVQMLWVPRRNTETGDVSLNESSLASRLQLGLEGVDLDIMALRHRGDSVMALGGVGYVGESALRADIMINLAESDPERWGFVSGVINMDRSWTWFDRNFYGLLEFYANGAGSRDYMDAIKDPWLFSRIKSGEIHLLGRSYLGGSLQVELHPLLNMSMTGMFNIEDKSCFFQPQLAMDASSSLKINIAADLPGGKRDTEFGGIPVPGTVSYISPPIRIYTWITYWF